MWKILAITQSVVLIVILGFAIWAYPVFRAVRCYFLEHAASSGDSIGVEILLQLGADPNGLNDRDHCARALGVEPTPPLFAAAWHGDTNVMQLLLKAHADPNPPPSPADDYTPIAVAAMQGHAGAARLLHAAGARLDLPGGRSVIELARQYGHTNVVAALQQPK